MKARQMAKLVIMKMTNSHLWNEMNLKVTDWHLHLSWVGVKAEVE